MLIYLICYVVSFIAAHFEIYFLSGIVLILAALFLYSQDYRKSRNLIHLRGLFSLAWVGGQGVACLKLSELQVPWGIKTWLCFLLAYVGFWVTYQILDNMFSEGDRYDRFRQKRRTPVRPLFHCMVIVTVLSVAAFILEAAVLGYIPLFVRGVPHAYSEFHLTGVHYFTVSCVLVPGMAVAFFCQGGSRREVNNLLALIMTLISLAIPILCVSRFQFIFAVVLAVFVYLCYNRHISVWVCLGLLVFVGVFYVILTVARSHDVEYLNGIFEMKNPYLPIFISQPYIYIANNYENFNCLVEALPFHTWGIRMLYPLWTLTGLKFLFPYLISFPIYIDKAELSTLTLFYDSYYDYGIIGVLLFACLLGAVCYYLTSKLKDMRNPMSYLFYGQFAIYMALSFFTTWFSNPTTWFYFIVTGIMALYCGRSRGRSQ